MFKHYFTMFIVILALAIPFTGCRKDQPESSKPVIQVASVLPDTGAASELGPYHRNACELFVSLYNENPDSKFLLRYSFQDSQSTPKGGVSAVQTLLAQRKPSVFVVHQSSVTMAVAPILAKENCIMLYVGTTEKPKEIMQTAFRIYPDPTYIARSTIKELISDSEASHLAIIVSNDEFGNQIADAVKLELAQKGTKPVSEEKFNTETSDFRPLITKVLAESPSAIYLIGVGNPLGRLVSQIRQLGFKGDIIGGPEMQFSDFLSAAGSAAEGVKFFDIAYNPESTEEPAATFIQEYTDAYGKTPTAASAIIYDSLLLMINAAEKAESNDPTMIAQYMKETGFLLGVCGKLELNNSRDVIYPVNPKTVRDGKVVPFFGSQSPEHMDY